MNGLILHRGGVEVSYEDVAKVATPARTRTWCPVSHADILGIVEREMTSQGMVVQDRAYALAREGARMFAVLSLRGVNDYTTVVGVRNSHDQSFPAALALGSRVFVCDNLAFSSEVTLSRKHTVNVLRDLPGLTSRAVARLSEARGYQDRRIAAYKGRDLSDVEAHDLMIRALDRGVAPVTKLPEIVSEYRKPRHAEFSARNVWSLFNAYTEILKGNVHELSRRTMVLHGLCDQASGVETYAPATN